MRRAGIALLAVLAACGSGWPPAFDEPVGAERFARVAIADPDTALTFARIDTGSESRVIAVTDYADGTVRGVDLAAVRGAAVSDPLPLYAALGYDGVRALIRNAPAAAHVAVAAQRLTLPLELGAHHIAAATNYPEHAADADVDDGPFLFAKLVQPTAATAPVAAGGALLDYEVELAWVTLAPLAPGDEPAAMGLILCNDFTDRDALLRHLDPWDVASGAGFTTGKSAPGYLPVGDLFVIPRDHRRFAADLQLLLAVNGELRQRAPARAMIWDFDALLAQAWAARERRWSHRGATVGLLADPTVIPARTLLLAGTPHGTVFAGIQPRHYAAGLAGWMLGGWDQPLASRVIDAYIADARRAGAYLQPGDRVEIQVDGLGVLRTPVI
ncbi:MAG: fumarylacetoacetate hydrolase family protein [Deltaproteobacteria bacterium]|nr:fumarylacetoacetate hydrolase family protein [Deltaproteobacteria bacterium]